jgi:hypothetical protein
MSKSLGASDVSEIKFEKGGSALSEAQKKEIVDLVAKARSQGTLDKIELLAWADKEYPSKKAKKNMDDINMAESRIKEVQQYLKSSLGISSVDSFNMAERPNKAQKFFNTPENKLKGKAVASGAAPSEGKETGLFDLKGQSSKVIMMVFLK